MDGPYRRSLLTKSIELSADRFISLTSNAEEGRRVERKPGDGCLRASLPACRLTDSRRRRFETGFKTHRLMRLGCAFD